jgi:hypothetical protein
MPQNEESPHPASTASLLLVQSPTTKLASVERTDRQKANDRRFRDRHREQLNEKARRDRVVRREQINAQRRANYAVREQAYASRLAIAKRAFLARGGTKGWNQSPEYQQAYQEFHAYDNCPECGRPKKKISAHCRACAGRINAHRPRHPRVSKVNHFCPNPGDGHWDCETTQPHIHCDCGWPISPDQSACHICIYEQSNVERVMAGKRFKGDGLKEAA